MPKDGCPGTRTCERLSKNASIKHFPNNSIKGAFFSILKLRVFGSESKKFYGFFLKIS
jgi:hypothetical protein